MKRVFCVTFLMLIFSAAEATTYVMRAPSNFLFVVIGSGTPAEMVEIVRDQTPWDGPPVEWALSPSCKKFGHCAQPANTQLTRVDGVCKKGGWYASWDYTDKHVHHMGVVCGKASRKQAVQAAFNSCREVGKCDPSDDGGYIEVFSGNDNGKWDIRKRKDPPEGRLWMVDMQGENAEHCVLGWKRKWTCHGLDGPPSDAHDPRE